MSLHHMLLDSAFHSSMPCGERAISARVSCFAWRSQCSLRCYNHEFSSTVLVRLPSRFSMQLVTVRKSHCMQKGDFRARSHNLRYARNPKFYAKLGMLPTHKTGAVSHLTGYVETIFYRVKMNFNRIERKSSQGSAHQQRARWDDGSPFSHWLGD